MNKIKLILADDHRELLQSTALALGANADFELLGTAANGRELVALCQQQPPDVAIVDIRMPEMDGVEAARIIRRRFPDVKLLMLTVLDSDIYIDALLKLHVDGYLLKGEQLDHEKLAETIRLVHRGASMLDHQIMGKVSRMVSRYVKSNALNDMEMRVAGLMAQGLYNKDIARELDLAYGHVRNLVSEIYDKLGVSSRSEVADKLRALEEEHS